MKIKKLLDGAAAVTSVVFPPVGMAIKAINMFLPDEDKLPETATGQQAINAFNGLPPEQQQAINEKYIELEIVESNNFQKNFAAAVEADKSGNTTRPRIAFLFAAQVFITGVVFTWAIAYAISAGDSKVIEQASNAWLLVAAILATPAAVVRAYFGLRSREKETRYAISSGQEPPKNILETILGR